MSVLCVSSHMRLIYSPVAPLRVGWLLCTPAHPYRCGLTSSRENTFGHFHLHLPSPVVRVEVTFCKPWSCFPLLPGGQEDSSPGSAFLLSILYPSECVKASCISGELEKANQGKGLCVWAPVCLCVHQCMTVRRRQARPGPPGPTRQHFCITRDTQLCLLTLYSLSRHRLT